MAQTSRLAPMRRETQKERVYGELRRALLAGRFEPGEPITAKQLAEELDAGLMPVRESVQQLVAEGAFQNLANGRVRVPLFTREEFDEIKLIRLRLEPLAGQLAVQRLSKPRLEMVESMHAKLVERVREDAPSGMITEANHNFHFALYGLGEAPHLYTIVDSLWLRVSPLLSAPFRATDLLRRRYVDEQRSAHNRLLDGLRRRDAAQTEAAIREIILASAGWYHRHYAFCDAP